MNAITKHSGAHYLFQGFALICRRELRVYVLMPLLINVILFLGLIFISTHFFERLTVWVDHFLPGWLLWLNWLLWVLFMMGVGLFLIFCFTMLANSIAGPFNSLLAGKVERYLTQKTLPNEHWAATLKDIPRTLGREWDKIGYFIPRATICLILFFVPIIQLAAGVIWFLFNGWMMAIQYLDYPADNHREPFKTFMIKLGKHKAPALGFGNLVMLLSFIPLLNCVLMPAAVAGATAFWVDILQAPPATVH